MCAYRPMVLTTIASHGTAVPDVRARRSLVPALATPASPPQKEIHATAAVRIMKWGFACVLLLQLSSQCCSRTLPDSEESVVSVYTTQPSSGPSKAGDVYHQIANNIAERITSPIYRFLGFGKNKTEPATKSTKKPWDKIESFDEPEDVNKPDLKPVANGIEDRDIEELSVEALKKNDKKPEKLILYSNYLPSSKIEIQNDTLNEIDDPFEFDDDDDDLDTPREGGFVYYLELIGSFIQLAFGAFLALFKPSTN